MLQRERSLLRFLLRGDVSRGERGPFAEEELLHLLLDDLLGFPRGRAQTVFIDDHLQVLEPHVPGLLGDVLIDALSELAAPRRLVEPRQLFLELHTFHHVLCHKGASASSPRSKTLRVPHLLVALDTAGPRDSIRAVAESRVAQFNKSARKFIIQEKRRSAQVLHVQNRSGGTTTLPYHRLQPER